MGARRAKSSALRAASFAPSASRSILVSRTSGKSSGLFLFNVVANLLGQHLHFGVIQRLSGPHALYLRNQDLRARVFDDSLVD